MKYAVDMGLCAMIYIPSFIKVVSGIKGLIGEDTQTKRQQGHLISKFLFFQFKESRLKTATFLKICHHSWPNKKHGEPFSF
jgi:hypothetical protein